jgi:hypothetical protein
MKGERKKEEGRRKKQRSALRGSGNGVPRSSTRLSPPVLRLYSLVLLCSSFFILHSSFAVLADTNTATNGEIPALRPPHAELAPTFWELHGVAVVICVVLFLALVGVAIWFLTRPKPPVVVPAEALARKALEPLGQRPEDGALLSQVSQILRHYMSAAFNLPPIELTTTEFCRAIAGHERVGPELSTALSEFLQKCDQRKFAPPAPAPPLSVVDQALKLIEQAQTRRSARA